MCVHFQGELPLPAAYLYPCMTLSEFYKNGAGSGGSVYDPSEHLSSSSVLYLGMLTHRAGLSDEALWMLKITAGDLPGMKRARCL